MRNNSGEVYAVGICQNAACNVLPASRYVCLVECKWCLERNVSNVGAHVHSAVVVVLLAWEVSGMDYVPLLP